MTACRSSFSLLFLCCFFVFPPQVASQPACETVEYMEGINQGKLKRTAHIKDDNVILFIALDPSFSAPEYYYGAHYWDEHFIEFIKKSRESLYKSGIDGVVI